MFCNVLGTEKDNENFSKWLTEVNCSSEADSQFKFLHSEIRILGCK
jgi:hypothetical protein